MSIEGVRTVSIVNLSAGSEWINCTLHGRALSLIKTIFWLSNPCLWDCIIFLKCIWNKYLDDILLLLTSPTRSTRSWIFPALLLLLFPNHAHWFSFWLVKMDPTSIGISYLLESVITFLLILSEEVECHSHAIFLLFFCELSGNPAWINFLHLNCCKAQTIVALPASCENHAVIPCCMSAIVK